MPRAEAVSPAGGVAPAADGLRRHDVVIDGIGGFGDALGRQQAAGKEAAVLGTARGGEADGMVVEELTAIDKGGEVGLVTPHEPALRLLFSLKKTIVFHESHQLRYTIINITSSIMSVTKEILNSLYK